MNLTLDWINELAGHGCHSGHWSTIGDPGATDHAIMDWARSHGYVVFTHDLDLGTMLALTHAAGPSVIQVLGQNVRPDHMSPMVLATIIQYESDLASGALVVVDEARSRVRIVPI